MSDPAPSEKPAPASFEQFRDFARRIIAVPKAEADAKERDWRKERMEKKRAKRA
jgi:hypothetical protein